MTSLFSVGSAPVYRPTVPENEVARLSLDLDRPETLDSPPLHLFHAKAPPIFLLPALRPRLRVEELVEQGIRSRQAHQTPVLGPRGAEVDDALDAVDAPLQRRLVDVRPRRPRRPVLPVRQRDVEGVEGDEELVGAPDLGEGVDDAGLRPRVPHELLVHGAVVVEGVELALDREVLRRPGARVPEVEGRSEGGQPVERLALVLHGPLARDGFPDDGVAAGGKLVAPVSIAAL